MLLYYFFTWLKVCPSDEVYIVLSPAYRHRLLCILRLCLRMFIRCECLILLSFGMFAETNFQDNYHFFPFRCQFLHDKLILELGQLQDTSLRIIVVRTCQIIIQL